MERIYHKNEIKFPQEKAFRKKRHFQGRKTSKKCDEKETRK